MPSESLAKRSQTSSVAVVGLIWLLTLSLTGCGGTAPDAPVRAPVKGTVTLDGQVLKQGVIRFVPTEGTLGPQTTAMIENGQFALPAERGPVVGKNRVEIESTDTGGLAMDDEEALVRLQSQTKRPRIEIVRVPAAYNERSTLTEVVPETGANDLSYELVSKRN